MLPRRHCMSECALKKHETQRLRCVYRVGAGLCGHTAGGTIIVLSGLAKPTVGY
eukprot:UN4941